MTVTGPDGKPKPWHHTLRKEKDGTLTPWVPLGIAAAADGTPYTVTLAPFTLLRFEQFARKCVFLSHETYTPARGGSAAAEMASPPAAFGAAASEIVIANTKGYTRQRVDQSARLPLATPDGFIGTGTQVDRIARRERTEADAACLHGPRFGRALAGSVGPRLA